MTMRKLAPLKNPAQFRSRNFAAQTQYCSLKHVGTEDVEMAALFIPEILRSGHNPGLQFITPGKWLDHEALLEPRHRMSAADINIVQIHDRPFSPVFYLMQLWGIG